MARWAPGTCVDCGRPANLRDPLTGQSRHKPCAERVATPAVAPDEASAALGPEKAAKRRDSVRHMPGGGHPYNHARHMDVLAAWPPLPVKIVRDDLAADEDDAEPAVAPPVEHVVPMRALAEGDPCPKAVHDVRAALERAGWTVTATYACVQTEGVVTHSVVLRAGREGVRAWAAWVNGKATGGQVQGHRGTLGITAWRVATGSAPTPKAKRKAAPPAQPTLLDLEAVAAGA